MRPSTVVSLIRGLVDADEAVRSFATGHSENDVEPALVRQHGHHHMSWHRYRCQPKTNEGTILKVPCHKGLLAQITAKPHNVVLEQSCKRGALHLPLHSPHELSHATVESTTQVIVDADHSTAVKSSVSDSVLESS